MTDGDGDRFLLPGRLRQRLLEAARAEPEREICGLVGGRHRTARALYPIDNLADDPTVAFYLDPHGQVAALRAMRENAEDLIGIFHSHPASAAEPSARDLAGAAYPGVTYLIVSLADGGEPLRAFNFDGQGFEEVAVVTSDGDGAGG